MRDDIARTHPRGTAAAGGACPAAGRPRPACSPEFADRGNPAGAPALFQTLPAEFCLALPLARLGSASLMRTRLQPERHMIPATVGDHAHRHRAKPGIIGWARINGSRGPVHTRDEVRGRIRRDPEYVNRRCFRLDPDIMLMTAPRRLGDHHRAR